MITARGATSVLAVMAVAGGLGACASLDESTTKDCDRLVRTASRDARELFSQAPGYVRASPTGCVNNDDGPVFGGRADEPSTRIVTSLRAAGCVTDRGSPEDDFYVALRCDVGRTRFFVLIQRERVVNDPPGLEVSTASMPRGSSRRPRGEFL